MNTSDPSATSPAGPSNVGQVKETGSQLSRSSTHADSGLSSSAGSGGSRSSLGSRKRGRNQQTQQAHFSESTNLFNAPGSATRNYQATETPAPPYGLRDQPMNATTDHSAPSNGMNQANGSCNCNCNAQNQPPQTSNEPSQSWKSRFIDRFGALELENKGSVARDHLALERTFLAWMRTSLAFASIGIAVTQLFRLNSANETTQTKSLHALTNPPSVLAHSSYGILDTVTTPSSQSSSRLRSVGKPLGSTFIGVSILILIVGFHRYFESQYWIVRGKFPASRGSVALTAFLAASLIIAALAVILAVSPSAIES
ncbi:uncharacterized protein N7477_002565 [Penicillium maclennaniae]|uniref:uncharacterized protein n=1 Tax=Penicillium maclennaniae TaxID=1343394 RepID=UPI00253FFDEE|nr:uncharacterized protein N7477_002565 [Penicillium maclennaniae]KAJ5676932.1 hypothetical protein N7477_002565 [Penicillium maclennaniae]